MAAEATRHIDFTTGHAAGRHRPAPRTKSWDCIPAPAVAPRVATGFPRSRRTLSRVLPIPVIIMLVTDLRGEGRSLAAASK